MSTTRTGADLDGMVQFSLRFEEAARSVEALTNVIGSGVNELDRLWHGPDSAEFKHQWYNRHRPAMGNAAVGLSSTAELIERNRLAQQITSAADLGPGAGPGLGLGAGLPGSAGNPIWDFLLGDIANLWNGGVGDGFPVGQLGAGMLRVLRTGLWLNSGMNMARFPTFNTGLVGQGLANGLGRLPMLSRFGTWLASPGATTAFRGLGVAGGIYGTTTGLINVIDQGWPWDAFEAEGAGYVADVASTAFSASTTAFMLAPNPLTAGLVIGTGLVWGGAELVDHWDEITEWTSDAWDAGSDWVGDTASDLWDAGSDYVGDTVSDAWDAGTGFVSDVGGFVGGVSDWF